MIYKSTFLYFINTTKNINKSIELITFGGGGQNYIDAGNRLIKQGKSLEIFNKTVLYTDELLKNDKEFWDKNGEFVTNNKRGYGYWLWKPYIIKKHMKNMNNGDILLYSDCGCEINIMKKQFLLELLDKINENEIINNRGYNERHFNKRDLLLKLDMDKEEYLNMYQNEATVILFIINNNTRKFVNEWYDISISDNYHNINDSQSIEKNYNEFIEHRHDQSIFSLLLKKYKIKDDVDMSKAIDAIRNRSGNSRLG
jgi:hypothetical protein